jgi:hypothetical protein
MKMLTSVALIVAAVFLTSAFWFVAIIYSPSQQNIQPTTNPSPTSTHSTVPSPTQSPTSTPKPTSPPGSGTPPTVPEFTAAYVDHSYDVPPTYGKDPYTGNTIVTVGGYHVDNRTIDITIKNQPFTPYVDGNNTINLFYNIRSKGHFEDWDTAHSGAFNQNEIHVSPGSYTTVSFFMQYSNISPGGQIDFQVQAVLSYVAKSYIGDCLTGSQTITVAQSAWSNTRTVAIPQ